ncbi:MAG: hypothetical protein HRU77_01445 [Gammaproteobacteria bacterium]|nr:MAG: hypothetical protein HRU77_01445 [Gammaproteobacteria bacterium]
MGSIFGGNKAQKAAKNAANLEAQIAKEQWDMYKNIYSPAEQQLVNQVQNYDTPEAYERAASTASGTVAQQFGKMYDRLGRVPGLDPSSPAATAALADLNLGQGLADVAAQNDARQNVRDTAFQRRAAVVGIGRGIPGLSIAGSGDASRNLQNISNSQFSKGIAGLGAVTNFAKDLGKAGGQVAGLFAA